MRSPRSRNGVEQGGNCVIEGKLGLLRGVTRVANAKAMIAIQFCWKSRAEREQRDREGRTVTQSDKTMSSGGLDMRRLIEPKYVSILPR